MSAHVSASLGVTALILLALLHFAASEPKPLILTVRPLIAFAPQDVRVEIRLQPNAANRSLRVVADSGMFRRDSAWTVDGERAQRLYSFWYKDLPAGTYQVIAAVASDTKVLASDQCEIQLLGAP